VDSTSRSFRAQLAAEAGRKPNYHPKQKTMKRISMIAAILSLPLVGVGLADDKKTTTYLVGMTGVT
jgi:hypothetical protein